jgi:hypothetical protein
MRDFEAHVLRDWSSFLGLADLFADSALTRQFVSDVQICGTQSIYGFMCAKFDNITIPKLSCRHAPAVASPLAETI